MFDVADHCGVSHQTVSRVVNNTGSVSNKTREKVLAAIEELGYQPNLAAKALATGKTNTIGVLSYDSTLYGPTAMLHSIQVAARDAGYQVVLNSVENLSNSAITEGIAALSKVNVDGVIVIAPRSAVADSAVQVETRVPIMFTETQDREPFGMVDVDQVGLGSMATEYLLELGHTKIAHIAGNEDWLAAKRRRSGFATTMAKNSLTPGGIAQGDWTPKSGYEGAKALISEGKFTAIFVANDAMAIGALKALNEAGLRVPQDVSLISVDDSAEAEYVQPALTSVRQQVDLVGKALLERLLTQIDGETTAGPKRKLIPGILMPRESATRI